MYSKYFEKELENCPTEITLQYREKIVLIYLNLIKNLGMGTAYFVTNILNKLKTTDDVCEFLFLMDEFQMNCHKDLADKHFSNSACIKELWSSNLISTVNKLKLSSMKKSIITILQQNTPISQHLLTSLNYSELSCSDTDLFQTDWGFFIDFFSLWANANDPTDEQVEASRLCKIDFKQIPIHNFNCYKEIFRIILTFTKCPKFQLKVFKHLARIIIKNNISFDKESKSSPTQIPSISPNKTSNFDNNLSSIFNAFGPNPFVSLDNITSTNSKPINPTPVNPPLVDIIYYTD
jgi:hypothetical protein